MTLIQITQYQMNVIKVIQKKKVFMLKEIYYTYFFAFLTLLNILCILILSFCIVHIIKNVNDYIAINNNLPEEKSSSI